MMKLFRKYNKQLLATVMVLLMIVFIGGSALESMMTPSFDDVLATTRYDDIRRSDIKQAQDATNILGVLNAWPLFGGADLTETDWVLLTREAKALGFEPNLAAARVFMASLGEENLQRFAYQLGEKRDVIYHAFAQLSSIQRAVNAVADATSLSAAEVRVAARNALEKVSINVVKIPAEALLEDGLEFTEAELEQHLQAFRDREPGSGLNFGYFLPPAIKLQYIKIDRAKVKEGLRIPNLDHRAKKYYEEHKTSPEFAKEPAGETGAGGRLTWEEAREKAIEAVKDEAAKAAVNSITNHLLNAASEEFVDVSRGEDGYRPAPEKVARLEYYKELMTRLPEKYGASAALAVGQTPSFSAADLTPVSFMGYVFRDGVAWTAGLRTIAFSTQFIVPEVPKDAGSGAVDYLATYETAMFATTDDEGNNFIFRVVDHVPAHAAESVDEVRDRLVEDLRLERAHEKALSMADALRCNIAENGLYDAFIEDADFQDAIAGVNGDKIEFLQLPSFSRVPKQFLLAGLEIAGGQYVMGVDQLPRDVVDDCFALGSGDDPVGILQLRDRAVVLLAEWVGTQLAREDEFETTKTQIVTRLAGNRSREVMTRWLSPDAIRARCEFKLVEQ